MITVAAAASLGEGWGRAGFASAGRDSGLGNGELTAGNGGSVIEVESAEPVASAAGDPAREAPPARPASSVMNSR